MLLLARNVATNSVLSIHYEYILIAVSLNVDLKMCRETYAKYNSFSFAATASIDKVHRIKLLASARLGQ